MLFGIIIVLVAVAVAIPVAIPVLEARIDNNVRVIKIKPANENDILETINTLKYAQLASKIKTKNFVQMEI